MGQGSWVPVVAAALLITGRGAATTAPTVAEVLQRAAAYVGHFQAQFASIIADERYEQEVFRRGFSPDNFGNRGPIRTRYLESELVLVFVPESHAWLGFRDVIKVDGRPVPDRHERLSRLLIRRPPRTVAELKTIADEGARFNIGEVERNTNQPLLVLLFLDGANQARFSFERTGTPRIDGVRTWAISYREQAQPTFIQSASVRDLYSEGAVFVDPVNGRVLRTDHELVDQQGDLRTTMTVRFRAERRLDVNVPVEMVEEYTRIVRAQGPYTRCRARYSNFRRFEVESRIVMPP